MKGQIGFILALVFAVLIAIFAVLNVEAVEVNYGFAKTESPLVLLILGSVLMGGVIVSLFGAVRMYRLKRQVKELERENESLKTNSGTNSAVVPDEDFTEQKENET
ncbi:DUF1049 domain-containing protein [Pueribacillus theae]|uniref:DUF1049 domain-containing protein n=1 Tax=Pueribacillus theae TaxID=2171751 RepID=A0A2U1JZR7_9BACI|nr:lipopolysaccharide assembly protein LapA domain-containing protein [Pueribacillus theae]PWA10740.1 DUF1049 domain-containing protein [Pueribacillus theae]